jgi:4-amino-4-deoxy-L-arabinose transferase-like glycosyltransferase
MVDAAMQLPSAPSSGRAKEFWLLFAFLTILTLLRLCYLGSRELAPDEAYFYLWSQHPAVCYYDKGPGVAMAAFLTTSALGQNEFGVRVSSPFFMLGASISLYLLAKKMFDGNVGLWTVIGANAVPIFNVGAETLTVDPASVFFWSLSLLTFWKALNATDGGSRYWLLTGTVIGLGFLWKWVNCLQLISVILVLGFAPARRVYFRRRQFYLLVAAFAICAALPVYWNSQRGWATLSHLQARANLDRPVGFHPTELLIFVAQHFAVYSPLICLGLFITLASAIRSHKSDFRVYYLLSFAGPVLVLYSLLSINKAALPNWTATAFLSLGILAAADWRERIARRPSLSKWAVAAVVVAFLSSIVILDTNLLRTAGMRIPYRYDPSARLEGWTTLAQRVASVRTQCEGHLRSRLFLIAGQTQLAAEISFYLRPPVEAPGHPPVYLVAKAYPENQFSFWPSYNQDPADSGISFQNRDALYIDGKPDALLTPRELRATFSRIEWLSPIEIKKDGEVLRKVRVLLCIGYHGGESP